MKIKDLFENRFGTELDGWYVLDKATDAVVAGPFDSKDEAQEKTMRPPMFANHHRYKIKAFGEALKEGAIMTNVAKFLKSFFKKPVEIKDDPQMMLSFEDNGGYEKYDVIGWQLGWKCFQMDPTGKADEIFNKMYYGGGSPFPFDEKSFLDAFKEAKAYAALRNKGAAAK